MESTDFTARITAPSVLAMKHRKMPKLPATARVNKRPLHHPAIPSAYYSSGESKIVYVSTKTPFMSAVKRVDKLLGLAEKRDVQSATATVRNDNPRKRRRSENDTEDKITGIAQILHERQTREEVVVKGTGRAIAKALEIGLWFQQRQQYAVKLKTGTAESIDDIEIDDPPDTEPSANKGHQDAESMDTAGDSKAHDSTTTDAAVAKDVSKHAPTGSTRLKSFLFQDSGQRDETRIRSVSVIEISISLR